MESRPELRFPSLHCRRHPGNRLELLEEGRAVGFGREAGLRDAEGVVDVGDDGEGFLVGAVVDVAVDGLDEEDGGVAASGPGAGDFDAVREAGAEKLNRGDAFAAKAGVLDVDKGLEVSYEKKELLVSKKSASKVWQNVALVVFEHRRKRAKARTRHQRAARSFHNPPKDTYLTRQARPTRSFESRGESRRPTR